MRKPISYLRSKFGKKTYAALDLDSGNMLRDFPDERAALLYWNDLRKQWPDVEEHLAIVEFDGSGMPIRSIQDDLST